MLRTLDIRPGLFVPHQALEMTAVRSAGPGGQNVNKVASKVDLRVDLSQIVGMHVEARERLRVLVRAKLDADGRLQLTSQLTRDQSRNLEDCLDKLRVLIEQALIRPVIRRATRPTRGSVERRLQSKREASERKSSRRGGSD